MRGKRRGEYRVAMTGVCVCSLCVYMCTERIHAESFTPVPLTFRLLNAVHRPTSITSKLMGL